MLVFLNTLAIATEHHKQTERLTNWQGQTLTQCMGSVFVKHSAGLCAGVLVICWGTSRFCFSYQVALYRDQAAKVRLES